MPFTPDITNSLANKLSPFGSGISKSLLTPCRRVGLSRKKKTPISITKNCSTPLNHEKSLVKQRSGFTSPLLSSENNEKGCKKKLITNFSSEEVIELSKENLDEDYENLEDSLSGVSSIVSHASNKKLKLQATPKNPLHKDEENKLVKGNPSLSEGMKACKIILNSTDYEKNDLVIKKRKTFEYIEAEDDDFMCNIKVRRKENPLLQRNNSTQNLTKKFLSSICDDNDDENDAFTSTPDREKNEKKELIQKISELEAQVKEKRRKLEALKQAEIYKTKHNISELKGLTEKWRQGCVLGMNSLLNQLQSHGPITMSTLVNNLHIPKEAVSKLSLVL